MDYDTPQLTVTVTKTVKVPMCLDMNDKLAMVNQKESIVRIKSMLELPFKNKDYHIPSYFALVGN